MRGAEGHNHRPGVHLRPGAAWPPRLAPRAQRTCHGPTDVMGVWRGRGCRDRAVLTLLGCVAGVTQRGGLTSLTSAPVQPRASPPTASAHLWAEAVVCSCGPGRCGMGTLCGVPASPREWELCVVMCRAFPAPTRVSKSWLAGSFYVCISSF